MLGIEALACAAIGWRPVVSEDDRTRDAAARTRARLVAAVTRVPTLAIDPEPLFAGASPRNVASAALHGDLCPPVFVGSSLVAVLQEPAGMELVRWDDFGQMVTLLSHAGPSRVDVLADGTSIAVLLEGERPFKQGRAGVIQGVTLDGTRVELGRKDAADVCPGGDGVGFKSTFAARDCAGTIAVEAPWRGGRRDRVMLFDPSLSPMAELECSQPRAAFEGFHGREVCWQLPSTGTARRFALWDPATGAERTAEDLLWTRTAPNGATALTDGSGDCGSWTASDRVRIKEGFSESWLRKHRGRGVCFTSPAGDVRRFRLPHAYPFLQWFARDSLLCTGGDGPPLAIHTVTGRGRYCFEDRSIGIDVASETRFTVLAGRDGKVCTASERDLA